MTGELRDGDDEESLAEMGPVDASADALRSFTSNRSMLTEERYEEELLFKKNFLLVVVFTTVAGFNKMMTIKVVI